MKRHQNKVWYEQDNREDGRLELETEIWNSMFPSHAEDLLDKDNKEDDAVILSDNIDDCERSKVDDI